MSQEGDVTSRILQGAVVPHFAFCAIQYEMVQAYHTQQANDTSFQELESESIPLLKCVKAPVLSCSKGP